MEKKERKRMLHLNIKKIDSLLMNLNLTKP
jgi:hypothetical protein